jgi:antibiotic biosynthesis monooxygenase (ABM) superfamily enzyme
VCHVKLVLLELTQALCQVLVCIVQQVLGRWKEQTVVLLAVLDPILVVTRHLAHLVHMESFLTLELRLALPVVLDGYRTVPTVPRKTSSR